MTVLPVVTGFLYRFRTQTIIRQKVYFRCCIWKDKFASVYQSTLAWNGQVWCFCDESPNIHGRRNKFRGCPCTVVWTESYERGLSAAGEKLHAPECSFSPAAESQRSLIADLRSCPDGSASGRTFRQKVITCTQILQMLNPFTATGYFDIPPPRWPTLLAMLFPILKEGMGLSLLDEFEVQYHVIKK